MQKKNVRRQEVVHRRYDSKPAGGDHIRRVSKQPGINEMKVKLEKIGDRGDVWKSPYLSKHPIKNSTHMYGDRLLEIKMKKIQEKMIKNTRPLDIEMRRKLYHQYTFRKANEDTNHFRHITLKPNMIASTNVDPPPAVFTVQTEIGRNPIKKSDSEVSAISKSETKSSKNETDISRNEAEYSNDERGILNNESMTKFGSHRRSAHVRTICDSPKHEFTILKSKNRSPIPKFKNSGFGSPRRNAWARTVAQSKPEAPTCNVYECRMSKPEYRIPTFVSPRANAWPARAMSPRKNVCQARTTAERISIEIQTDKPKKLNSSPMRRHKRKPLIKTLTDKRGDKMKVYKSVCFVDQKKKAPLKIKIGYKSPLTSRSPSSYQSSRSKQKSLQSSTHSTKLTKHKSSFNSIHQLILNRKFKNKCKRRRCVSPDIPFVPPPVTEVAKWAPQSVNEHTKPYYEAWVNTTLTAVSADNEKLQLEKQRILKQMQDRIQYWNFMGLSEEELSDERYTGRIRVNHR